MYGEELIDGFLYYEKDGFKWNIPYIEGEKPRLKMLRSRCALDDVVEKYRKNKKRLKMMALGLKEARRERR